MSITECKKGYFGDGCSFECHCDGGASCDPTSGRCHNDKCASGWRGQNCSLGISWQYLINYNVINTNKHWTMCYNSDA